MDWQQLIIQFQPLYFNEVMMFAPPREMEQAINTYNRAIFNLNHDSTDVAMIALRKLVATYPMFAQANLLLGCCQAQSGQYEDALEQFAHARLAGLPDEWQDQAQQMQTEAENQRRLRNQLLAGSSPDSRTSQQPPAAAAAGRISPDAFLEKSRRRGRVRMASAKERQAVIRQAENPEKEETVVKVSREPVEYLRLALPILAGLAAVILLFFAIFRWLPGLADGIRQRREASVRLEWLLDRLDTLSAQDQAVDSLLDEYQAFVQPSPMPSPSATEPANSEPAASTEPNVTASETAISVSPTPTDPSQPTAATTAPTAAPTPDPASVALQDASRLYLQAVNLQSSDLAAAAQNLLAARELLAGIPGETTAPDLAGNAATLRQDVESLITAIARNAAEVFRVQGMDLFNRQDYSAALPLFLTAYELYPKAYGGGVAYYCGRCYQLLGDYATAKPYYEFVIANFAGRDIAGSAAARLEQMGY
ncbi:MAG TPA: hypothetical protein DD640_03930 [Clostridiales bacterium]|nr:hypothetical protein [Clostridiales bacterium]